MKVHWNAKLKAWGLKTRASFRYTDTVVLHKVRFKRRVRGPELHAWAEGTRVEAVTVRPDREVKMSDLWGPDIVEYAWFTADGRVYVGA